MVLDPWLWWVEMIVTVVVSATRDHGFESPVLHEWLPPATPWTYMDSFSNLKPVTQTDETAELKTVVHAVSSAR